MLSANAQRIKRELLAKPSEEALGTLASMAGRASGVKILAEFLTARNGWLREQALAAVCQHGTPKAARRMARQAMQNRNPIVRDLAAECLGTVGTNLDAALLVRALEADKFWPVRASAASALGEIRTAQGIAALKRAAVSDRQWNVRAFAVDALCVTCDRQFLSFVEGRIRRERNPAVWPSLYASMVDLGESQFGERIIDMLFADDFDYLAYLRACIALESIYLNTDQALPERAIEGLQKVLAYDVGKAAKWAARDLLAKVGEHVDLL